MLCICMAKYIKRYIKQCSGRNPWFDRIKKELSVLQKALFKIAKYMSYGLVPMTLQVVVPKPLTAENVMLSVLWSALRLPLPDTV